MKRLDIYIQEAREKLTDDDYKSLHKKRNASHHRLKRQAQRFVAGNNRIARIAQQETKGTTSKDLNTDIKKSPLKRRLKPITKVFPYDKPPKLMSPGTSVVAHHPGIKMPRSMARHEIGHSASMNRTMALHKKGKRVKGGLANVHTAAKAGNNPIVNSHATIKEPKLARAIMKGEETEALERLKGTIGRTERMIIAKRKGKKAQEQARAAIKKRLADKDVGRLYREETRANRYGKILARADKSDPDALKKFKYYEKGNKASYGGMRKAQQIAHGDAIDVFQDAFRKVAKSAARRKLKR